MIDQGDMFIRSRVFCRRCETPLDAMAGPMKGATLIVKVSPCPTCFDALVSLIEERSSDVEDGTD